MRKHSPLAVFLTLGLLSILCLWLASDAREPVGEVVPGPAPAPDRPKSPTIQTTKEPAQARVPVPPIERGARPTFEELFGKLVDLGMQQRRLAEQEDMPAARAVNERIQALLTEILDTCPDADGLALQRFSTLPVKARDPQQEVAARACEILLASGLARRQETFKLHGERSALDGLVSMILVTIGNDELHAEPLSEQLVGKPYLGIAHEPKVMELVRAAARTPWLASIASALLRTLWQNLEAQGLRRPEEIAALALLEKDSESPSTRLAALKTLLAAADGRFRALVEQEVMQKRDAILAKELAAAAALELAPKEALDLLIRLTPIAAGGMIGPFMSLGHRDPALLQDAYERMLAQDVDPRVRAELVTGAGFEGGENLEIARTAFEHDRDPEVRSRAIFVLTAKAGSTLGEKTLMAALDDRALSSDPVRLTGIVLALENLVGGDPNVIDRIGRRILARSELTSSDRKKLGELLARSLPGGGGK